MGRTAGVIDVTSETVIGREMEARLMGERAGRRLLDT